MADDLYPAYVALIRRELKLPAGSDGVAELKARLSPDDPAAKPPSRAPGITRLRKALRRLEKQNVPAASPELFAEDLRFLELFASDGPLLSPEGARRLLDDVFGEHAPKSSVPKVTPFPRIAKKRGGG